MQSCQLTYRKYRMFFVNALGSYLILLRWVSLQLSNYVPRVKSEKTFTYPMKVTKMPVQRKMHASFDFLRRLYLFSAFSNFEHQTWLQRDKKQLLLRNLHTHKKTRNTDVSASMHKLTVCALHLPHRFSWADVPLSLFLVSVQIFSRLC